jgi:hypothetical protein
MHFSYPGHNEMLTGAPDARIDANEFGPNPNVTVFEWLNRKPEFQGHVAAFATWNAFKDIFNVKRSHLTVQAGWDPPYHGKLNATRQLINDYYVRTIRYFDEGATNALLQIPLLDYVRAEKPRLLFVGYGETDIWGHGGRYDLLLQSARQFDLFVKELWDTMQAMPQYRGKTTFILTADHGRGSGLTEWTNHGVKQKGSDNIWIAVIGPDTPPLGERTQLGAVTQSQIASTVACFLGRDYHQDCGRSADDVPLSDRSLTVRTIFPTCAFVRKADCAAAISLSG